MDDDGSFNDNLMIINGNTIPLFDQCFSLPLKSNIISLSFHCYQCLLSNVYQCLLSNVSNVCIPMFTKMFAFQCLPMFSFQYLPKCLLSNVNQNVCFPIFTKMFTSKPFSRWSLIDSCGVKRHWEEVFSSGTSHFLMMRLWILMTHDLRSVSINFPIG